jgi:hypothetical protein
MKFYAVHEEGYPAGWTDDLGIIADKNTYVTEHLPGWYVYIDPHVPVVNYDILGPIRDWCDDNIKNYWSIGRGHFYFSDEKDLSWFMLKWNRV